MKEEMQVFYLLPAIWKASVIEKKRTTNSNYTENKILHRIHRSGLEVDSLTSLVAAEAASDNGLDGSCEQTLH